MSDADFLWFVVVVCSLLVYTVVSFTAGKSGVKLPLVSDVLAPEMAVLSVLFRPVSIEGKMLVAVMLTAP